MTSNQTSGVSRLMRVAFMGGVSTLALGALATPSFAQTAAPAAASTDTIVITGIRGSLQKSMNVKKKSVGVVDAISSEDIGKFPDSNLAASMQRIPGVSISRGASTIGGLPTTTGDATEITVRGFGPSYNTTLYDERQIGTATGNRGFDFSAVSSDFVNEIDVEKTPDASLSSGAIGATIDIKFPKPFDHPGLKIAGSLSGNIQSRDGSINPSGGILFSDTFGANDQFGILADYAYSDQKTSANHLNIQGWEGTCLTPNQFANGTGSVDQNFSGTAACATGTVPAWFIQDYGIYREDTDEARSGGRLVLQWRPMENLTLTLNDDYSQDDTRQVAYGASWWFNAGQLGNVVQNGHGTITDFVQGGTAIYSGSSPTDFQGQIDSSFEMNNEYGFNAKWDVNDKLNVMFDVDNSDAWLNPGGRMSQIDSDVGYGPSQPGGTNGVDIGVTGVGNNSLPYLTSYGPNNNESQFINNGLIGSHVFPFGRNANHDAVTQAKLQATWTEDNFQLRAGVQYVDEQFYLSNYGDFSDNDWQAYSGYGSASNNYYAVGSPNCPASANGGKPCPAGVTLPQNLFTGSFSTSDFIPGFSNGGSLPPRVLAFNPFSVLNYLQGLGNPQAKYIAGSNTTCCSPAFTGVYTDTLSPGSVQQVDEATVAAYVSFTDEVKLGGMPLKVNVGVRAEQTNVVSTGIGTLPTSLAVELSDHTAYAVTYGPQQNIRDTNDYRYLLPNLDLNLGITDNIKLRFDASRTLTRPPLGDLTPDLNVTGSRVGALTASGGNPDLLPYLSDNVDLGLEWYYSKNSYAAIDGYVKQITNFVQSGATTGPINGVTLPSGVTGAGTTAQWTISDQVNSTTSYEVSGLELALQHVFGETGFGFQANGTLVGSSAPYNPDVLGVNFALTGLADSANFVAFYDKHGFQARVAVNYRAAYLDHFGQQQNGSSFGSEPTFVNGSTQIDFSTSYDVSKNLSIFFEGLNLNDATYSTHGRFTEQLLDAVDYGSRYTLGVHFRL